VACRGKRQGARAAHRGKARCGAAGPRRAGGRLRPGGARTRAGGGSVRGSGRAGGRGAALGRDGGARDHAAAG
jgi:hypothetical protein